MVASPRDAALRTSGLQTLESNPGPISFVGDDDSTSKAVTQIVKALAWSLVLLTTIIFLNGSLDAEGVHFFVCSDARVQIAKTGNDNDG